MKRLSLILLIIAATSQVTPVTMAETWPALSFPSEYPLVTSDTIDLRALVKVSRFNINVLPPSTGIQFYRNGIVFLSNSKAEGKIPENHTSFGTIEVYYAAFQDTSLGPHSVLSPSTIWTVPCDAMTFNSDYSVMYFTKKPSARENEKIFAAKYQSGKKGSLEWVSDSKPLSFCEDRAVYSNPTLSKDGEKMIYTSDRGGGLGQFDLYISYLDNADWSSPINLGNKINTPGNDMFPFLDGENNLYFSSDGIKGTGGYDIYFCRYTGNGWDKPVNLTSVINSEDDDLAFTLSRLDGKTAFYTRKTGEAGNPPQLFRISFRDQVSLNRLEHLSNAFSYLAQAGVVSDANAVTVTASEKPSETIVAVQKPPADTGNTKKEEDIVEEAVKPPVTATLPASDIVVYRVQYLSSGKPTGKNEIYIEGKKYNTFEYLYNGAYRLCAGNFASSSEAVELQKRMKRTGYPDAFVVSFRNNVRSTEPINPEAKAQVQETGIQPAEVQPAASTEGAKPTEISASVTTTPDVVFRIQFIVSSKPKGSYELTVAGKKYKTYEYVYNGTYRSCVGEFPSASSAVSLQKTMKQNGYPDAFIVAFKDNVRTQDPELFKK